MQTETSQKVTLRFFEALDSLKASGDLRFLTDFTEHHHINRRNLWTLRQHPEKSMMQLSWLTWLVEDYGISADWLLTGRGEMQP